MKKTKCILLDWEDICGFAEKSADSLKKTDFYPDVVVGLSRGGLVPARLFCDFLNIKNCYTIKVDHWGITASKNGKARLSQKLNINLSGKKVLVVDDITDTGQSLKLGKKHIKELKPEKIKTATLIHLDNSEYKPDFFGIEREWAWMIFPWNYNEDMVNLVKRLIENNYKKIREIKNALNEFNDLDLSEDRISEILAQIDYLEKIKTSI